MDVTLIANLEDIPAVQNYLDKNSPLIDYNSPLYQAQQEQIAYMAMKQRKPMVIEYYDPTPDGNGTQITSVEMYINPERLVMQTQKLKSKQVTRGGIFYHHAGDDHWSMQLSGSVGLSGMRGIEQLEKIYYHSGALLKYTDLGPDTVQSPNMPSTYEQINLEDPFAGISYLLNHDVSANNIAYVRNLYETTLTNYQKYKTINNKQSLNSKQKLLEICTVLLKNYESAMNMATTNASYNQLYMYLNSYVSDNTKNGRYIDFKSAYQECQRRVSQVLLNIHPQLQVSVAYDLAKTITINQNNSQFDISTLVNQSGVNDPMKLVETAAYAYVGDSSNIDLFGESINDTYYWAGKLKSESLSNYINEIQDFNERSKINSTDASAGWLDIKDELTDPWRPRQIFIYFEDRVYIGHFDSFSWQREASTPLIRYDMHFTVTRQIIVTSTNDKEKPLVLKKQDTRYPKNFNNFTVGYTWEDKLKYYATNNNNSIQDAKNEILRIKEAYINEKEFDILNGQTMSDQRITDINRSLTQIRQIINISESDDLYGTKDLTSEQRLQYYAMSNNNVDALNAAKLELSYIKALILNKKQKGTLDPTSKQTILGWLISVHQASGITEIQTWEYEIM